MIAIKGKDVDLYVYRVDEWVYVACAVSVAINVETEVIPTTTIDSGLENEYESGATDANIDFSGVVVIDVPEAWQFEDFVENVGVKQRFLIRFLNSAGNSISYDMYAIITNVSGRGEQTDIAMFDASMIRSGAMTKLIDFNDVPDDPDSEPPASGGDLVSDWWPTVPGEHKLIAGQLSGEWGYNINQVGDTILELTRDGITWYEVFDLADLDIDEKYFYHDTTNDEIIFHTDHVFGELDGVVEKVGIMFYSK